MQSTGRPPGVPQFSPEESCGVKLSAVTQVSTRGRRPIISDAICTKKSRILV